MMMLSIATSVYATDIRPEQQVDLETVKTVKDARRFSVTDDEYMEANVSSSSGINTGALEATEEQMEYWAKVGKRYGSIEEIESMLSRDSAESASWKFLSAISEFVYLGQENMNTCGSACVRMALRYFTGIIYSEETAATGCNTTATGAYLSNMVSYIRSESSKVYYLCYRESKDNMKYDLLNGLCINQPPIVGVKESTSSGWPYNLNAHFVTVYGMMDDYSVIALADPWAGYLGDNSNLWYDMSLDYMYNGYNGVNLGYAY